MRYSPHDYAMALVETIEDAKIDRTHIEKNFLALVRANGDEMQLKKILDEASRLVRGKGGARDVAIESARPLSKSQEKTMHKFIKAGDAIAYTVNPNLIAGVKITVNDEMQFDGTMKAKLDILFS